MQVDRPRAELAAAGIRHLRPAAPGENRAEKDDRRAHPPHQLLRHVAARQLARVDEEILPLPACLRAEVAKDPDGRVHIAQARAAPDQTRLAAENRRGQHRQHAVFRALYRQLAAEPSAALHCNQIHIRSPFPHGFYTSLCGEAAAGYFFTSAITARKIRSVASGMPSSAMARDMDARFSGSSRMPRAAS